MGNLINFENDFAVKVTWDFVATSHGKGGPDAVGAVVKNVVHRRVISQNLIVNNAHEFCALAIQHVNHEKINIVYVETDEMNETRKMLEERLKLCPAIPQIQKLHHYEVHSSNLECWPSSKHEDAFKKVVTLPPQVPIAKRGRGRPRKIIQENNPDENKPPKKRGRPAKKAC